LRHIEYENTPSGLKSLATTFKGYLDHFARNPLSPDSQFQEIAKLTNFQFPDYSAPKDEMQPEVVAMLAMMQSPEMIDLFTRQSRGEPVDQTQILEVMAKNPAIAGTVIQALAKSGHIDFAAGPAASNQRMQSKGKSSQDKRRRR
jgi:hypothetical protein